MGDDFDEYRFNGDLWSWGSCDLRLCSALVEKSM